MKKYRHIMLADRERLDCLYGEGASVQEIADAPKVNRATVYNELRRGYTGEMDHNGRPGYSAKLAQKKVFERRVGRIAEKA